MPSRRAVLTAALAAGALAACTPDDNPPDITPQPDDAVLAEAVAEVEKVLTLLASLTGGRPARRAVLADTRAVHEAHLRVLQGVTPTPHVGPRDRHNDHAAFLELAAAEDRLTRRFRAFSLRAESGSFARALAGISASAAQQSAWLRSLA